MARLSLTVTCLADTASQGMEYAHKKLVAFDPIHYERYSCAMSAVPRANRYRIVIEFRYDGDD